MLLLLLNKIEKTREHLYHLTSKKQDFSADDVLEISRKLDVLIYEYETTKRFGENMQEVTKYEK